LIEVSSENTLQTRLSSLSESRMTVCQAPKGSGEKYPGSTNLQQHFELPLEGPDDLQRLSQGSFHPMQSPWRTLQAPKLLWEVS
jgi:hypothetical protein